MLEMFVLLLALSFLLLLMHQIT